MRLVTSSTFFASILLTSLSVWSADPVRPAAQSATQPAPSTTKAPTTPTPKVSPAATPGVGARDPRGVYLPGTNQLVNMTALSRWAAVKSEKAQDLNSMGVEFSEWARMEYRVNKSREIEAYVLLKLKIAGDSDAASKNPRPLVAVTQKTLKADRSSYELPIPVSLLQPQNKIPIDVTKKGQTAASRFEVIAAPYYGKKNLLIKPEIAFSYVMYTETGVSNYNSFSATGKLTIGYQFGTSPWDMGMSSYITIMPLTKNTADGARFLGVNLRGGYKLPFVKAPWSVRLLLGGYYTTMIVDNNSFGFSNMFGPQVFPVISRDLAKGSVLSFFGKYSPISQPGTPLDFRSREMAAGFSVSFEVNPNIRWSLEGSWSNQSLIISDSGVDYNVSANTYSFGAGVAF